MQMSGQNSAIASADNRFLYGGKEYQNHSLAGVNINWYDFGARNYDAQLGRWFNIDPLSESFTPFSPYNYCLNQPMILSDPTGLAPGKPSWWSDETMPRWGSRSGYMFAGHSSQKAFSFDMYNDGYRGPGFGQNGTGLGGVYYDWYSGFCRSTDYGNPSVGWMSLYESIKEVGYSLSTNTVLENIDINYNGVWYTTIDVGLPMRVGKKLSDFRVTQSISVTRKFVGIRMNKNSIVGVSVGFDLAFEGKYTSGFSFFLLYDGDKFALGHTLRSNPRKVPLCFGISVDAIEITSNDGEKVKFSDLAREAQEYKALFYTIGGNPKGRKGSSYKFQSINVSPLGWLITHGEYDTWTTFYTDYK